jgi:hypothetical protein
LKSIQFKERGKSKLEVNFTVDAKFAGFRLLSEGVGAGYDKLKT